MELNGGRVVQDVACDVSRIVLNGEYYMRVSTETKVQILAKKVLVATGAFTGFRNLLPNNLELDVGLLPLTVAKQFSWTNITSIFEFIYCSINV
jgi:glycine/D-amino acid oxidase-like deaminating enzyme